MKFKLLLSLSSLFFFCEVCNSQCNYRVKQVSVYKRTIEFLLPPKAKIAKEGFIFHKKKLVFDSNSRFRYQYIIIQGVKSNYSISTDAVNRAIYKRSKKKISSKELAKYNISQQTPINVQNNWEPSYYISSDSNNIIFEVDYDVLLRNGDFASYAINTYKSISSFEQSYSWAKSITQNLVEKIFELLPSPSYATLYRYMFITNSEEEYSFLLLNPKIWLAVDNVEKSRSKLPYLDDSLKPIPNNNNFWNFNLNSQTDIHFYRDKNGNLMQSPFLPFPSSINLPYNNLDKNLSIILQSSTADIQMSRSLNKYSFIGVFQKLPFKQNNQTTDAIGHLDLDNDFTLQNSQLLFFNDINKVYLNLNKDVPATNDGSVTSSTFGLRNFISPMISILANDTRVAIQFNSTFNLLKSETIIPDVKKIKLYRIYKKSYRRVGEVSDDLPILPSDKFVF